jgi:hypothetical protein
MDSDDDTWIIEPLRVEWYKAIDQRVSVTAVCARTRVCCVGVSRSVPSASPSVLALVAIRCMRAPPPHTPSHSCAHALQAPAFSCADARPRHIWRIDACKRYLY